jgi:hypothetical protein
MTSFVKPAPLAPHQAQLPLPALALPHHKFTFGFKHHSDDHRGVE